MYLVEPDTSRFGWGFVRYAIAQFFPLWHLLIACSFVSDLNMTLSERDGRDIMALNVSVYAPLGANARVTVPSVMFSAKLIFDDISIVATAHNV